MSEWRRMLAILVLAAGDPMDAGSVTIKKEQALMLCRVWIAADKWEDEETQLEDGPQPDTVSNLIKAIRESRDVLVPR